MNSEFNLTGPNVALEENVQTSYFMCVEKCDQYSARTKIEEKKVVGKEEGELTFETSYTPYIIAKANYRIVYLRRNRYNMSVPSDVDSVKILNKIFINSEIIKNEIKVEAIEKIIVERADAIELDFKGNKIKIKEIPPHNEIDASFYDQHQSEITRPKFDVGDIIQELRDRLVNRPSDVSRSIEETFNVEVQVILRTYYWGIFKTDQKEKKMRVDSVTGKSEWL
ncbi:MAG: hypothetical protein ACTSQI_02030 [Candidatus Helarchaeota archaeon]